MERLLKAPLNLKAWRRFDVIFGNNFPKWIHLEYSGSKSQGPILRKILKNLPESWRLFQTSIVKGRYEALTPERNLFARATWVYIGGSVLRGGVSKGS